MRPLTEPTKTTRPRAARIIGSRALVTATWPMTLVQLPTQLVDLKDLDRTTKHYPGVIDEPVEPSAAHLLADSFRRRGNLLGVGYVEHQRLQAFGPCFPQRLAVLFAPDPSEYLPPIGVKSQCSCVPDAG
jgi:hypothetical protein